MDRAPAAYISQLSKDRKLAVVLSGMEPFELKKRRHVYLHLCNSIMGQQLSTTVAATLRKRFLKLYKGVPTPQQILDTPHEKLRSVGLSGAKSNYLHNVAQYAINPGLDYKLLGKMTNEQVSEYLTQIKGVGKWTAEMLMMFTLGREDVFAVDDLGIQKAMIRIYKLEKLDKKSLREKMLLISAKWSPYRTFACLHLWHHKDNSPDPVTKKTAG